MFEFRGSVAKVITVIVVVTVLVYVMDTDLPLFITYLGSVLSAIYAMYRLFISEVENIVIRVYEERLKKDVEDVVIRVYEERLRKDVEKIVESQCRKPK